MRATITYQKQHGREVLDMKSIGKKLTNVIDSLCRIAGKVLENTPSILAVLLLVSFVLFAVGTIAESGNVTAQYVDSLSKMAGSLVHNLP